MDRGFSGLDGKIVHHLNGSGKNTGSDNPADGGAGFSSGVKCSEQCLYHFGAFHDTENHLGRNAKRALGADEYSGKIVTRSVEGAIPQMNQGTIRQYNFQSDHMRGSEAILQ